MTEAKTQSARDRRQSYLAAAIDLRKMAYQAHSEEMQRAFMQLAVLYEELAEYTSAPRQTMAVVSASNGSYSR